MGISNNPFDPTAGSLAHSTEVPDMGLPERESLTEDETTPSATLLDNNEDLEAFLAVAGLCNVAKVHKNNDSEWASLDDSAAIALQVFASGFGHNRNPRLLISDTNPHRSSTTTSSRKSSSPGNWAL